MKYLVGAIVFVSSAGLFAQTAGVQTAGLRTPAKRGSITRSADETRPNLAVLLAELEHVTTATTGDVSDLRVDKWKSGWRTGWLRSSTHKREAEELMASLKSNLKDAMPALIHEAQDSSGSMAATFRLYNDLSAVVESVSALSDLSSSFGKKEESGSLHNDYTGLNRIRQELASYIQLTADSLELIDRKPRPGSAPSSGILSAAKRAPEKVSGR